MLSMYIGNMKFTLDPEAKRITVWQKIAPSDAWVNIREYTKSKDWYQSRFAAMALTEPQLETIKHFWRI